MQVLPPLPQDTESFARSINDAGDMVGLSMTPNPQRADPALHQTAMLWENDQPVELQSRLVGGAG
jgi:hypothetical protein